MISGAVVSDCGLYRYLLWRVWDDTKRVVTFCMLNPSTADAEVNDATILTIIQVATNLGYGGVRVVNLYAYRATEPRDLKAAGWPIGPENDRHLVDAFSSGDKVICAWGANARGQRRQAEVLDMVRLWTPPLALRLTKVGEPCHPLYLPRDLVPFDMDDAVAVPQGPAVELAEGDDGW